MLVLTAQEVKRFLDMRSCIDAVETAFRTRGLGGRATSAVAGVALTDGKLHAKLATLDGDRPYAVTKINANIPGNPSRRGLPSIQGVVVLFDAVTGTPLAVMDSGVITAMRTAAASAVAARWLASENAYTLAVIGCGIQARAHLEALLQVRPIRRLRAYDIDPDEPPASASEMPSPNALNSAGWPPGNGATAGAATSVRTTPS